MAKTQITTTPDGTIKFELTFSAKAVKDEYQHALAHEAAHVEVKGFRKGKAPLSLVEAKLDRAQLLSHTLNHLLTDAYTKVVRENKLMPLTDPQVTPKSMKDGEDWVMAVETATTPQVDLGSFKTYVKAALKKLKPAKDEKPEDTKQNTQNAIFDALLDHAKLEVSPVLVKAEYDSALARLNNQLTSLKLNLADYAKSLKKKPEDLEDEYKKTAEANLKLEFILQALIKEINPEVTADEVKSLNPPQGQEVYAKYVLQKRKVLDFLSGL